MKISTHSTVPVYTISGSSTARALPEWLARKRKRSLKHDPEYASRIELLQDFEFEEASSCVRVSEDGNWVMSTGTYKPQIHVHNLSSLSLSFARHTNSLNDKFVLISEDYSKSIHLQNDRYIEFHTPAGRHHTLRVPRYGRDIVYCRRAAEALIPAVGLNEDGSGEVFRLNLELGRFMKGYEVDVGGDDVNTVGGGSLQGSVGVGAVNTAAVAEESHNLLAFGTSLGTIEFWDPRSRGRVGILSSPAPEGPSDVRAEITCLEYHRSGTSLAVGGSDGLIRLYDLRSPVPLLKKDQGFGFPIKNLIFLDPSTVSRKETSIPKILSADKRIIKIWDSRDGSPWTSVEPAVDLNHVAWVPDSGMLLTANEGRQQHSFLIPQLGPAPKWCAFLDNLVEEMAEDPNDPSAFGSQKTGEVYDNYKFLTLPQLKQLNMAHLVGKTTLLRPYMHGYFVAQRLYEEAKLISNPEIWEQERARSIKEKIDKERDTRIRGSKKANVKVNRKLAERIMEREEKAERYRARKALLNAEKGDEGHQDDEGDQNAKEGVSDGNSQQRTGGALVDPRFARVFQDEDFQIDENSWEFRILNPSTKVEPVAEPSRLPKGLTAVEREALQETRSSSDGDSSSEDDEEDGATSRKQKLQKRKDSNCVRKPEMVVSSSTAAKPMPTRDKSFGARAASARKYNSTDKKQDGAFAGAAAVGEKEISFVPRQKTKAPRNGEAGYDRREKPRHKDRRSASGNVFRRM